MPLPLRLRSFSLRTLMVLVGVCAVAAWLASERRFVLMRRETVGQMHRQTARFFTKMGRGRELSLLRRYLGDYPYTEIILECDRSDAELERVAHLFPEADVWRLDPMPPEEP